MQRSWRALFSYFVAASFLANLLLGLFVWLTGPESPGIRAAWFSRPVIVQEVAPNSPAARADVRAGDRLLRASSHPIHSFDDWRQVAANIEVGQNLRLKLERDGALLERNLEFPRRRPGLWGSVVYSTGNIPVEQGFLQLTFIAAAIVNVGLAVLILLARPTDLGALLGALFLGVVGALISWPEGFAAAWRHAPWVVQPLLWVNELDLCVGFGILLTFLTIFPKPLPRAPLILTLVWIPDLVIQPWLLRGAFDFVYRPEIGATLPAWLTSVIPIYWVVYMVVAIAVAVFNYRSLQDANDRRRVRLIFAGLSFAVAANLPRIVFARGPLSSTWLGGIIVSPPASMAAALALVPIPISFAIAILRDRLFDIRILIRQGVRHGIARGVLLSITPVLALILAGDLAVHADQPLANMLRERGWIYASIAAVAMAAHVTRKRWLVAIDRHFFREKYNAEQLLRESVQVVRNADTFIDACRMVVERIETALHPQFVGVFVRGPGEAEFHLLARAPVAGPELRIRADCKVVSLLRLLCKSLDSSGGRAGWLEQLPHDEVKWIEEEGISLLVPIRVLEDQDEALLLFGPKRSEEPYGADDREILQAIGDSLGLSFAREPSRESDLRSFRECPTCGGCQQWDRSVCAHDGSQLVRRPFARVLAGRYHIERRIGVGGMGAVYEAADLVLQRRVAAKLIREELGDSPAAIARFEREARLAAKFSHPSVVTVFDFGVTDHGRPFLVMELLEGRTLRSELRARGQIDAERTLSILSGVCAGVDAAHQRGLIHRDLKPENIFLTLDGAKILDFGLSKFVPTPLHDSDSPTMTMQTVAGSIAGTLEYMSPEQLEGTAAVPSITSDVWALGVISYEMITGTRPFAGANPVAVLTAIRQGQLSAPAAAHLPEVSDRLRSLYEKVFSLHPQERPAGALLLLRELSVAFAKQAPLNRISAPQ